MHCARMIKILRKDERAVASAVATILVLLIVVILLQITVIGAIPKERMDAEYATSLGALQAFQQLRQTLLWPLPAGSQWSLPVPMGTAAVSPFTSPTQGTLSFGANTTQVVASYNFVPQTYHATVSKVYQDVILVMDSSGSMAWNDPSNLRITGAQEYVGRLNTPDRVAIVSFNQNAYLVPANIGKPPDHLNAYGHNGIPDYTDPQADLATINANGNTNIGGAIQLANDELINYGDPNHAWVEIVLTDGQNNYAWEDTLTIQQAQRAAANNITIYTIGLSSSADAALLTQVASTTGGTYYSAPTASSIRWIYLEISMHYQASVQCGSLATSQARTSSLSLDLLNQEFTPQTIRLDGGGVGVSQPDGAYIQSGLGLSYNAMANGSADLTVPLLTLTGQPFTTTGTGVGFINARVVSRYVVDQPVTQVNLTSEVGNVYGISDYVQYWANQGAATQSAAAAVEAPLNQSAGMVGWAATNVSSRDYTDAYFNVNRASAQLSGAITAAQQQASAGNMQSWLAQSVHDQVTLESCRLEQWTNWYQGLKLTIISPEASAWAQWFTTYFQSVGASFTIALSGNVAYVQVHLLNHIITDERIVDLWSS